MSKRMSVKQKGLYNPFIRWWVVFSIMAIAILTALFAGFGSFILHGDRTYLSWLILTIFFGASLHLGYKAYVRGTEADFNVTTYFIETCTSLGLLGTIIGLIMMIVGAFHSLDISNQASIKTALVAMSSGIGTALITTLVGLISALFLRFQLTVVREKWRA